MPRPRHNWKIGARTFSLGERTWIMAVLNLTPDSFFPGSRLDTVAGAVAAAEGALEAGADILDLGGESTRPGAQPVPPEQERARLLPALEAIRRRFPAALLSADTRRASVAAAALAAGADIINDVGGLGVNAAPAAGSDAIAAGGESPAMAHILAASDCGIVAMHARGEFATMHRLPPLADPSACAREGLRAILAQARAAGIDADRLVLDPGFGFGKNLDENFPLLAHLNELRSLGRPLLVGLSRKSFLGHAAGDRPPAERLPASLAALTAAVLRGAAVVRAHDVAASRDAARIADAVLRAE